MRKIRNKRLHFKTYGEWDDFCEGKDIQRCEITIDEKLSDLEEAKRYHSLIVNIKTGQIINFLP